MAQMMVTLLVKYHKTKTFNFMGSILMSTKKSITLKVGKLNHTKKST